MGKGFRAGVGVRSACARALALGCLVLAMPVSAQDVVTTGGSLDYMPSVIRSSDDGARIVVFERLDPGTLYGDLWLTRSADGSNWSAPVPIIAGSANERHPALLQRGPGDYLLFYLRGMSATSSFRIWRASSVDGTNFVEEGPIDLGWATGGEINPHVIRHPDGTLTMSYQRLGSGSYVAQSTDGGLSWDTERTAIALGSQLPRIAWRESDGLYLASYQVGSSPLAMYVKTTTDVHDWSAPAQGFALAGNNHDSLPVVMPDGAFALFWIRWQVDSFDLAVRRSLDGVIWEETIMLTDSRSLDDVEPHPLVGESAREVELYWAREAPGGGYEILREAHAPVQGERIFADGFESGLP